MKRRSPVPGFAETAAPLLPLLTVCLQWQGAVEIAFFTAALFAGLTFLFRWLAPAFPKNLVSAAFVLTVCTAVYVLPGLQDFRAYAALSVCLLWFPFLDEAANPRGVRHIFLKAFGFLALALYLAAAQEFLGRRMQLPLFQRMPGVFFLLIFPALVWPASRRQKGVRRQRKIPVSGVPV